MRPISDIFEGDVYRPAMGLREYCVLEVHKVERMALLAQLSDLPEHLNRPFWKKNTDSIFNNRVQLGWGARNKQITTP